ncbi:hypothetical protein JVX91_00760 [Pseudomonas sp. PDNC002]|uniref:hypothetical protein n=1 Tax=Pseudomonas sp. PDNC002 TaxID=2811422 RepID=UPI0019641756|nr:hypothetical protein [Pseudomonas sp. PDNC002]QRY79677.1 hypothetical protein JVX91_00760 [Pseudomonas sp. PDNC002]
MTEQQACTLCGAGGHTAAQRNWGKSEREQFEAWVLRERPGSPLRYVRDALPVDDPRYGEYCDDTLQCAWEGWRARAALAQPSPARQVVMKEICPSCEHQFVSHHNGYINRLRGMQQPSPAPELEVLAFLATPTEAMLKAYREVSPSWLCLDGWRAMMEVAPVAQAGQVESIVSAEFSQFLSAVMDAAGLVRHGRRSKELSEYLGAQCIKYRQAAAPAQGGE